METKFTKAMEAYNSLINTVEYESEDYKRLCLAKYIYIKHS